MTRLRAIWSRLGDGPDPVSLWHSMAQRAPNAALLHSSSESPETAPTSILAFDSHKHICLCAGDAAAPFADFETPLEQSPRDAPPVPFAGGWLGWIGYDILHRLEDIPTHPAASPDAILLYLHNYRQSWTYDHQHSSWIACTLTPPDACAATVRRQQRQDFARACDRLSPCPPTPIPAPRPHSTLSRDAYESAVNRALAYIHAGDIYQVNLARQIELSHTHAPEDLVATILRGAPAPFAAALPGGEDNWIASVSPERFFRVRGNTITTCPIKGTRPRGSTPEQDAILRRELIDCAKEQAELTMITDLLRNDLGKVCVYGSISVDEPRRIETFPTIHHAQSTITGTLRPSTSAADIFRAMLPGGSITGAPKIRAMEIIRELEPTPRGIYCGCTGYLDAFGRMDFNIAIRTACIDRNRLIFGVGSGIVSDSRPSAEYDETQHKARAILQALGIRGSDTNETTPDCL